MGWQDIYKKKMQESGLAAGDINFVDVDTFHKREKERWASEVATGSVQTVTAPAKQEKEKYVASPYGTFLGGFSYKGIPRRQKTEQELADEAAQQAAYIKEYQRLAGLDLDSYGKQVESAKKAAQDNRTMYNVRAFGGYDASRMTDEERTYAAMQADYNKARDIQYDIKGQAALENLTAEQSKAVETLATERSDTAKRQTAWTALQKTGLSDDDISQLVNYQRNIPKRQKNAERYAEMQDAAEAYAETNPGLATLASVPANLLSGLGTIDAAMRKLSDPDSPVDYKSGAFLPYAYARGVRGTVTKNLESDYGKGASFAYGVGTSILDSAATVGLAALGIPAGVASATLGGAAATSAMTEAKARGLSDGKAILTGVLSGVAETALEKFSLESLISMKLPTGTAKQRVVGALKNAAVQAGIEGSEEMFTDFANLIFDSAVNGSLSDMQQRIAVYMAGGMDYDEARKKVLGETVKDVALDFVAGGLAGGLMGGGNMALQTAAQGAYESRVNDARMAVRQRAGVTGSYHAAEDGKTSYNGQETSVRSVVKDGKVELTTGETVNPKDVQFSDRNTADLYEGAIRTAENAGAAQVFVDSYTGGDVSTYILGMQEAYHNGKEGVPLEDAGGFAADLSDAQRRAAWEQGRAAASVPDLKDYGFGDKGTQAWNKVQENEAVRNNRRLRAGFTAMYQAGMRGESASAVKSDAARYIPPSVQTAAYEAGLADAAESLARETDAVQFVSSAGSESGLVDNEYARKLAKEKSGTAALLSMLGKDLGVRVEIVPKVLGGNANGQYVAGRNLVQIAADADDAFEFVAAHEVTHRMQSLAPEEYRSYRDYAMRFRAQELGEEGAVALVERYRAMSEEAGVTLTQEEAMDEIAANFTMRMIEDGGLFEDFARENRSEAGKLLDALKAFIAKVKALFRGKEARDKAAREAYGTDMATLEECVARWQKAYTAAGKAAQNAKTAAGEGSGEGRYQIKKIDGRLMTVIDTQNDTRDFKAAEAYLKTLVNTDHPFSTILMDAQPVYVGKDLPGEYRSSEYTKSMLSKLRDVKMQAATNLDEMLLLAENGEWRENVKPKHAKDAQNGWYRYDAEFAVPILNAKKAVDHYTVYGGTLLIRNDADGKSYLYDLLDIEKKKVISAASFSAETHSEVLPPKPSVNSISTSDGNVNAKFSLKGMDSAGRQLSEQQQEYFKDSKVRDAEGRLKPVYHGSDALFTKFSADFMSKNGSSEGQGFYFTDLKTMAQGYEKKGGQLLEGYLDIKNPLSDSKVTLTSAEVKRLIKAIDPTGDDLVLNYDSRGGMGYPSKAWYERAVNDTLRMTMETSESDSEILAELANGMGNPGAVLKAAREVLGYDGYIVEGKYGNATVYVAFDSSQFKNMDNLTPTSDPDIRFQLKSVRELEQEVRELKKERTALLSRNKTLEARVEKWRKETRRSSPSVRADDVKKMASTVIREYGSSVDYQDIEADMTALGEALMADDVSMDTLRPHARAAAEKIIDGVLVQSESGAELLEIRDHLKGTTLKYTDDGTIPDFSQWRKSQKGKLRISKDSGVDVDVAYAELTEMFGEGYFPSSIIHTGDQLVRMSEVLENVGRIYENPFDGYRDAAVTELSNLLIDGMIGEDVRQSDPTFADRKALELQETKARMMQMLIRTREGRDRQVERMRRHYAEQTKAGRERRNATALRAKIARHTADLSRKLLTPTDKQHVPEKLRTSVAALLASINQESSYSYDADGRLVHNTEGDPTKRTQAAIALKSAYDEILRSGEALVIDPDLLGSEGAGLLDQVMAFGNKRMADMNSEELTTVWQAVRAIEQSVSTFNKSLASQRYETVSAWAESLKQDSATRKRKNRKLSLDLADPYTFFSAYGESGMQIFRTLRNAQDRQNTMLKTIQAAAERFADKTVFKNRNDRHTFTTEAGQTLTLTTGQVMNLYNLVGRGEQAVHHLMVGGVVQPEILRNGKNPAIPRGTENIRLTENDLKAITGTLTEVQKSVAEGLQKIASGHLAAWGNEASMLVYGYRKFTEKNYWPIKAAQEGTTQNSEKGADMAREIKNMGSAKALVPNASNALDIGDVYDVFSQNASDMIQYATLLAPMEDINRLYNYRFRDAEGNLTGKVVKHVLTDVYGEAAQKYWRNLMRDVQNGMEKSGTSAITKAVEKVVGGMKAGSVGFNLRVVVQQRTAYFRAAAVIDPAHMAKGLVKGATEGNGWEKAKKYAPIAAIKDTSGFDQSGRYTIAQNVFGQDGNALMNWLSEASVWAAGKADAVAWEQIWNACEWAVVSENSYEKGSDGFYQRTAQLFTEVIDQSQVVDGILQRAQIMRDSNGLTKQATAFMGEPLKAINMLMRSYDAWRYETDTPKKSKALKRFARTVSALLVTDVVNSLVQSVIDGLRDDDKDKAYGERIMAAWLGDKDDQTAMQRLLGGNLWENLNPVGRIPYAKDVLSMLQGFTVSRMDADAVGDLIDAAELFVKSAQDEGSKTTAYAAKKLLTAGSKIFGISIANVGRDAWAIARSIAQGTGNVRAMYEMERAIYRLAPDSGNNKRYYKLLYMAMGKDEETYRYIYDDMKKRGYTDSQLQTGIKDIIKDSGADEDDMRKQLEEIGYTELEATNIIVSKEFKEKYGYSWDDRKKALADGVITESQLVQALIDSGELRLVAENTVKQYKFEISVEERYGFNWDDRKTALEKGDVSAAQLVGLLVENGKKRDEAEKTVENYQFEIRVRKQYGFDWSEREYAYDGGYITESTLKKLLIENGKDEDEAQLQIKVYDWREDGIDIDSDALTLVEKYEEVSGTGIDRSIYADFYKKKNKLTGDDLDGDGRVDNGSKQKKVIALIDSLPLTNAQKDALFVQAYSQKTLWKATWH